MMKLLRVTGAVLLIWLAAVAAKPLSDDEANALRAQREAVATVVYPNVDQAMAASAVLQALRSIDPNHVQAEAVEDKVLGLRTWSVYAVFAVSVGIDYYEVLLEEREDGIGVSVRFDREANTGPFVPRVWDNSAYREGLNIYGRQGATIDDYSLFHDRVAYFLGQAPWPACRNRPRVEQNGPSFVCRAPGAPGNPDPPEI